MIIASVFYGLFIGYFVERTNSWKSCVELSEIDNSIELRKNEYPSIEEVMHVILDHGLDSEEYNNLQDLRTSIKNKCPKI